MTIELKVKLSGKAEEQFKDILLKTQANEYDVFADALALLHCSVESTMSGKRVGIYDPQTKEFSAIDLTVLYLLN